MKRCEAIRDLMSALIDSQASTEETRLLQAHLVTCDACRREHEALQNAVAAIRGLSVVEAPADLVVRVRARLEAKPEPLIARYLFNRPPVRVALAAALVLVVCISGLLVRPAREYAVSLSPSADRTDPDVKAQAMEPFSPVTLTDKKNDADTALAAMRADEAGDEGAEAPAFAATVRGVATGRAAMKSASPAPQPAPAPPLSEGLEGASTPAPVSKTYQREIKSERSGQVWSDEPSPVPPGMTVGGAVPAESLRLAGVMPEAHRDVPPAAPAPVTTSLSVRTMRVTVSGVSLPTALDAVRRAVAETERENAKPSARQPDDAFELAAAEPTPARRRQSEPVEETQDIRAVGNAGNRVLMRIPANAVKQVLAALREAGAVALTAHGPADEVRELEAVSAVSGPATAGWVDLIVIVLPSPATDTLPR